MSGKEWVSYMSSLLGARMTLPLRVRAWTSSHLSNAVGNSHLDLRLTRRSLFPRTPLNLVPLLPTVNFSIITFCAKRIIQNSLPVDETSEWVCIGFLSVSSIKQYVQGHPFRETFSQLVPLATAPLIRCPRRSRAHPEQQVLVTLRSISGRIDSWCRYSLRHHFQKW